MVEVSSKFEYWESRIELVIDELNEWIVRIIELKVDWSK